MFGDASELGDGEAVNVGHMECANVAAPFTIERGAADAMDSMERRLERLTEIASADTLAELAKDEVLTSKIVLPPERPEAAAEPQPEAVSYTPLTPPPTPAS